MELKYYIVYGICILVLLYILYKLHFEKRYRWHTYDDDCRDPDNIRCSKLIYSDRFQEGLLVEYFYNIRLTRHLVDRHIQSKNRAYRTGIFSRIQL